MRFFTKTRIGAMSAGLALGLISQPALAFDWDVQTTADAIEASYVPNQIPFTVKTAAGSCGQGSWLYWNASGSDEPSKIANVQAVFSLLLTAKMADKMIEIYGYNNGCAVAFIHITN